MVSKAYMKGKLGIKVIIVSEEQDNGLYIHRVAITFLSKEVFSASWRTGSYGPYNQIPEYMPEVTRFQVRWFGIGRVLTDGAVIT